MSTFFQDLRYGARMLMKQPGFTLIAVLTLALGIGANTAIFSVVKGVLLSPLPYPQPQELVRLFETIDRATMASDRMEVAPANFLDWQARTRSFAGLAAFALTGSVIGGEGEAERLEGAHVVPLLEEEVGRVKPALLALLGAVGLVLLIACVNVAGLLLARAAARQTEIGVRLALGAGRWRIVRQLLTESVLLAGLGGVAGLLVGGWALDLLLALAPENLPRLGNVQLDASVLGFTLLLTLATGVAFGLAPAWSAARQDVNASLKSGSVKLSGRRRLFSALIAAEIALTLVVLIGAGLLVNSFLRLQRVEPGLDVERLLTVTFEPPSARYNGDDWKAPRLNFWNQISVRVAALPGVEAVAAIDSLPLSGQGRVYRFRKSDEPDSGSNPAATFQVVTPDYFRAVGVKLQRGRLLAESDREDAPPVIVINETMARRFWPNEVALGKRIFIRNDQRPTEIVGVVNDVKHFGLEQATEPEMYRPFNQLVIDVMPLVVRAQGDPAALAKAIRLQVRAVDPTVAVERIAPMSELLSDSLAQRRFTMLLLGVFAGTALLLAAIGVYGVMAYSVTERTREIGLRMALGAPTGAILRLVLRQGMTLALAGVAIGLLASLVAARLIADLLFGVSPTDPLTFSVIALALLCVAFAACWIPARRATKVDPMVALRTE